MDGEQLEPLDIDDRSPGERMIASGRAGVGRLHELVDEQRLDIVALIWVGCIIAFTGVEIYSAFHALGGGIPGVDGWTKVALLGQTGGPTVAVSCLIGIAVAVMSDTPVARLAILLAGVVGAWVLVAGVLDIASAVHQGGEPTFRIGFLGQGNRAAGIIGGLALGGFGLVVMMIAWRAGGVRPAASPEVS
ncbi:MAG TPA: hypothetical protein VL769_00165 [Acidimicrobiia bacterium]|nr:hypothetical protein [Acidimicrobiia bacterium]